MTQTEIINALRGFSTPELCDGMRVPKAMDWRVKPMVTEEKVIGPAFTVDPPVGVSGIIPDAILQAQPGDVLVIAGHGLCSHSYWGDHRSICAKLKGLAGVVIDGAFRDVEGCEQAGVPIYARSVTPVSCGKAALGRLNVPVVCGGLEVLPGDLIVADRNGVVVLSPDEAEAIMSRARKKLEAQERTVQKMLETGEILPRIIM